MIKNIKRMQSRFAKFKIFYQKEGFFTLIIKIINHYLKKFKINIVISTPLEKYKDYLAKEIISLSSNKVMHGMYKDTYFKGETHWNLNDFASKLLGCYELQIQEKISEIRNKYNLKNIINIGSGEGYHIISLIKNNYFEKGYAFEISAEGQEILKINSIENNIENKIKIFSEGNFTSIKNNINEQELKKSFFLIDIEGGEFSFFNKENIKYFNKNHFIIEEHDITNKTLINDFYKIINNNFTLEIINNSSRNPFQFEILNNFSDDEKFLMMSESRPNSFRWLYLSPKT
jgi:hypothetical protein